MSNVRNLKQAAPELSTRKPTGLPPWPIMLLAGVEKSGKSYAAAAASASEVIGRTLWVSVGEDDPDEYGAIPGARFEIVQHDGTYRGILDTLTACAMQPEVDGKPNLIVLDSATRLWALLSDEQQVIANARARRKAERNRQPVSDEDASIGRDQWNTATDRWGHIIDTLREHAGPSIVTALLEQVSGTDAKGQPTVERFWKVQAQKRLPADVGVIVELLGRNDTYLTGVRSLKWQSETGREKYPDFTVEKVWRDLGLTTAGATAPRQHSSVDPEDKPGQEADAARAALAALCDRHGWKREDVAAEFLKAHDVPVNVASAKLVREFVGLKTPAEVGAAS